MGLGFKQVEKERLMKTAQQLRDEVEASFRRMDGSLPWIDAMAEALEHLETAAALEKNFDSEQHARDIRDQQMQDARS